MSAHVDEFDYSSPFAPAAAVFAAADEPLLVFPSATAAERFLEATDVENGIYPAAYGPLGEPYRVYAIEGHVVVERADEPVRPHELKTLLLRYLEESGREAEATASIEALVAQVWTIESKFREEHDPFGDRVGTRIPLSGCLGFVFVLAAALYFVLR
ncbi:hypothetical protein [Sphingomonas sp.]|uniref:hypothetical protein n=1 Tax=Sphingomonas sp. TaxID=28214 RepID=UPI002C9D4D7D|nr:hypothetical protein [Sphingomonas sp.]HWK35884.1 hypothetical protein [Sphingomonas sp.]